MTGEEFGDALRFLSAMPAWLRGDGELWFEAPRWPQNLVAQLSPWRLRGPRPEEIQLGTLWPRPELIGVRCADEAVALVVRAAESLAAPEVCDHFHVCADGRWVASWYDFGSSAAPEISGDVGDERRHQLAALLGSGEV